MLEMVGKHLERARTCDTRRIVFLDEAGFRPGMALRYGRARKGGRVFIAEPKSKAPNHTLVMGMGLSGCVAPMVLDGPMNSDAFVAWLDQELLPSLERGDMLVMDNLRVHRSAAVRERLEAAGVEPWYLPPYSPDLNPIEMLFSKLKHIVRSHVTKTIDDLYGAIANGLDRISRSDLKGWIGHAGYCIR